MLHSYATSYPLSPPHLRALQVTCFCCAAVFPNFSKNHDGPHTLEGPANGESKCALRLKIVETPRIFQELLDRRPDLEPPHVRRQRCREAAHGGAFVSQGWIANLAGLDEILGRQKLGMQSVYVVGVVDPEGRLNDRQLHDELDACRTAQAKICSRRDAQPPVRGQRAGANGARKAGVEISKSRRIKP